MLSRQSNSWILLQDFGSFHWHNWNCYSCPCLHFKNLHCGFCACCPFSNSRFSAISTFSAFSAFSAISKKLWHAASSLCQCRSLTSNPEMKWHYKYKHKYKYRPRDQMTLRIRTHSTNVLSQWLDISWLYCTEMWKNTTQSLNWCDIKACIELLTSSALWTRRETQNHPSCPLVWPTGGWALWAGTRRREKSRNSVNATPPSHIDPLPTIIQLNKLETFQDAPFESGKTKTHKTDKLTHWIATV